MQVPSIENDLGISTYASKTKGIGGRIKRSIDDFIVEETLVDGSTANAGKKPTNKVLSASLKKQRYLLCILVKRNWDMFIAIKTVAKELGLDATQIKFAGIKDAKALTAQYITIDRGSIEDILALSLKDIQLYPLGYIREHLSAYYLLGNTFTININEIDESKTEIKKRVNSIVGELEELGGIPNYYGHQRFGTKRPITHLVGKAIIEGKFEKAIMMYLSKYSESEHPSSRQARKDLYESQNFAKSIKDFPKQLRFELLILSHLVKKPNDFVGAFERLPFKLQALFVQAYQSYLFNLFLSERLDMGFSLNKATIGDYVVNVERSGLPMVQIGRIVKSEKLKETNDLIKLGKLRVALPLVGIRQKFSNGIIGEMQKKIFEKEQIKPETFRVPEITKISGKGGLRAIVTPLNDYALTRISSGSNNSAENQVSLHFMLLRGSYATIFLREIIKSTDPITAGF